MRNLFVLLTTMMVALTLSACGDDKGQEKFLLLGTYSEVSVPAGGTTTFDASAEVGVGLVTHRLAALGGPDDITVEAEYRGEELQSIKMRKTTRVEAPVVVPLIKAEMELYKKSGEFTDVFTDETIIAEIENIVDLQRSGKMEAGEYYSMPPGLGKLIRVLRTN